MLSVGGLWSPMGYPYGSHTGRSFSQCVLMAGCRERCLIMWGTIDRTHAGTMHAALAPQSLPFAVREDGIHVAVPELDLWGILQLELENTPR